MGWLTALLSIAAEIPQLITIVQQIVSAIKGAPTIPSGVAAVQKHMANFPAVASPSEIKTS